MMTNEHRDGADIMRHDFLRPSRELLRRLDVTSSVPRAVTQ